MLFSLPPRPNYTPEAVSTVPVEPPMYVASDVRVLCVSTEEQGARPFRDRCPHGKSGLRDSAGL